MEKNRTLIQGPGDRYIVVQDTGVGVQPITLAVGEAETDKEWPVLLTRREAGVVVGALLMCIDRVRSREDET